MALADWTTSTKTELYRFFAIAFDAAPGVTYMNQLYDAVVTGNMKVPDIVEVWTTKPEFLAVYPRFMSNLDFATKLVDTVAGTSGGTFLSTAARTEAITDIAGALNAGKSRGYVIYQSFTNLTNGGDATWTAKYGDLAKVLDNQVSYAQYFTETLLKGGETTPDATALRAAVSSVTPTTAVDAASIAAVLSPTPAVTLTLTTGTDTTTGGAGADTINAPLGGTAGTSMTFAATDVIDGGAGRDTLYVESNIATVNLSLVKSVEAVSVNARDNAPTVTLPTDKAVTALTNSNSTVNVTFANVANAATTLTLSGGAVVNELGYTATALTGAADSLGLTLNATTGSTVQVGANVNTTTNNLETIAITTVADSAVTLNLANMAPSAITIAGAGATTLTAVNNAGADLRSVNASNATGAVTVPAITGTTTLAVTGGSGNDNITGGAGNDALSGGAGDDTITGGAGNDNIDGGAGSDRVVIVVSDVTAIDTIAGGDGTDTLSISGTITHSTTSADVQLGTRFTGFEVVRSNATGAATIDMTGLNANNAVASVIADGNNVTLTKDTTVTGVTFLSGSTITVDSKGTQAVTIGQASGTAALSATLATGATALNVTSANKLAVGAQNTFTTADLTGSTGSPTLATVNLSGANRINFVGTTLTGVTTVNASGVTATANTGDQAVTVNVSAATGAVTFTPGAGTVNVTTGAGADAITGTAGADVFSTGAGNDTITAGAGDDTVTAAGAGNDTINLGDGNDTVTDAGAGDDSITGGSGNDTVTTAGDGNDTLDGGEGNDTLTGNAGNDVITGGDGIDTLSDGAGNDSVTGGAGNDTLTIADGIDTVDGGDGDDGITITGLGTGDSITGGAGNDTLTITNSSSSTLVPTFTSIESAVVRTSSNFTLDLTEATDKTSLKTYNISSTDSAAADAISLTNIASGSTVTISDDATQDTGASTDDTGDIGAVTIDTVGAATLTVVVAANVDGLNPTGTTTGAGAFTVSDANTLTINTSGGSSSNRITHAFNNLVLDNDDTVTATITAAANAGLTTGAVTGAAALETLTFTSAANAQSSMGTIGAATNMKALVATSTGTDSSLEIGAIGGGTASKIASVTTSASAGSSTTLGAITATGGGAGSGTVSVQSLGANSTMRIGDMNLGTQTLSSLTLTAESNSTLGGANAVNGATTITSGAVTASTVTLSDFATVSDGANNDEQIVITGAQTALTMTIGRNVTFTDDISFTGNVTRLNLTLNNAAETVVWDNANDLNVAGGTADVLFAGTNTGVVETRITHNGTGTINYDGSNVGISSVTGNIGNDTLTGAAGNDILSGGVGADTITGGAANDTLTAGEGADTVNGGAGNDVISLTETSSASDLLQMAAVGGASTDSARVQVADALDTGSDVVTGYNLAADTTTLTVTGVIAFVHGTHTTVGTGTTTLSNTGAAGEFTKLTGLIQFDSAAAGDAIAIGAAATGDTAITYASLANGANAISDMTALAATETAWEASLRYNITGTAVANTITTGGLNDTVSGGDGSDTINIGAGNDTVVLTGTAIASDTTNIDTVTGFIGGTGGSADSLAFGSTFLGFTYTSATVQLVASGALASGGAGSATDTITIVSNGAAANASDNDFITFFGNTFSAAANQKGVFIVNVGTTAHVYYVNDSIDGANTTVTAADVVLIGVLTGTDAATLVVANIINPLGG
jgi:Ca2+-binding RTX toxin-like protein